MGRLAGILLFALWPGAVLAQAQPVGADPEKQVHWAVASFFGTGWYRVDDNRSVYVLRIPPRQTVREAYLADDGRRKLGVEIQYPISVGLNQLEDIPDFIEFENYSTISFTPGVQVEIPINSRWALRPYAHIGAGYERKSGEWAGIWYGGIKSRYLMGDGRVRWSLLNGLYYAGYKPQFKNRGQYGAAMAGLEFSQPLKRLEWGGEPLFLNWHLTYSYFFDQLNFHVDEDTVESFRDQWELGLAFGHRGQGMKIWFMTFEHVGLAFRWSSNGKFDALTVNFRSPFTY
jgi:hypothetical protein